MPLQAVAFHHPGDEVLTHAAHRIFCIDCSYSMAGSLSDIRIQLQNKIASLLRPEDFMSLVWFSGRGQYGTIFEHYSIKNVIDLSNIHASIQTYLKPVGSTGFVEPARLIKTLVDKYPEEVSQVYFLTDGCENTWSKEECKQEFSTFAGVPTVLVEYGYSCDRQLLDELAEVCGGLHIFNEDFPSFEQSFGQFMLNKVPNTRRTIPADVPVVYMGPDTGDVVYRQPKNGVVSIPDTCAEAWYIRAEETGHVSENRDLYIELSVHIMMRADGQCKALLTRLGDRFVTRLYAATYSKQDYSRLLDHIKNCIHSPDQFAFREGVDHDYMPPDDMFNVLTLLQTLEGDHQSRLHPYHAEFGYSRIAKTSVANLSTTFLPNKSLGAAISLVYHSTRANVSIQCAIHGHTLTETGEVRADKAIRNYTVIKDGIKHVTTLPVSISEATFHILQREGCIAAGVPYERGTVYVLDLTHLPVVNRKFILDMQNNSILDFATKHVEVLCKKASVKYWKKRKSMLEDEKKEDKEKDEESAFSLSSKRGDDDGKVRDFYTAPELSVKIGKCSSLPTVNEKLLNKLDGAYPNLTLSESLMWMAHIEYKQAVTEANNDKWKQEEWLMTKLTEFGLQVRALTGALEQQKTAYLLGGLLDDEPQTVSLTHQEDGGMEETFQVQIVKSEVKVYMD